MASPRMIQRQFGAVTFSSGAILPNQSLGLAPTLLFNEVLSSYMGVTRHDDRFYVVNPGGAPDNLLNGVHFATFDQVDLRDLIRENQGMDDVTINVQRMYEVPYPNLTYNMAPGNIEETLVVILGDLNMDRDVGYNISEIVKAGFAPVTDGVNPVFDTGLPFRVLYREVRQYIQDPSQNFVSPDQIGSQGGTGPGADPTQAPTRFVGNYRLASRTIGGYPDLVVGPAVTIIRAWSVYPANRSVQALNGGNANDTAADEYTYLQSQVEVQVPPLQLNIVGTQRNLTDTEIATYYTNILNTE